MDSKTIGLLRESNRLLAVSRRARESAHAVRERLEVLDRENRIIVMRSTRTVEWSKRLSASLTTQQHLTDFAGRED